MTTSQAVIDAIAERTGMPVSESTDLSEVARDSLEFVDMIQAIEIATQRIIPLENISRFANPGDIVRFLDSKA